MTVRAADADDLPEIAALIRELADYEQLAHEVTFDETQLGHHLFGPSPAAHVLMAEEAGSSGAPLVCGFALYFCTFSTFLGHPGLWLEDLFVRPAHRGKGHGAALIQHLRSLTDGRLEWAVLDWNEGAVAFYEGLGARPVLGWTRYRWSPG